MPARAARVAQIAAGVAAGLGIGIGTATLITQDWLEDEGWRLVPYLDSAGIPTVCAGHTGRDVVMGRPWTEGECIAITIHDLVVHGKPIIAALNRATQGEIRAWVNFAGNTGITATLQSTGMRLQREGQRIAACEQMLRWTFITVDGRKVDCRTAGRLCPGLPARRDRQMARCLSTMPTETVLLSYTVEQS